MDKEIDYGRVVIDCMDSNRGVKKHGDEATIHRQLLEELTKEIRHSFVDAEERDDMEDEPFIPEVNNHNYFITGGRGSGKSTFLRKLVARLESVSEHDTRFQRLCWYDPSESFGVNENFFITVVAALKSKLDEVLRQGRNRANNYEYEVDCCKQTMKKLDSAIVRLSHKRDELSELSEHKASMLRADNAETNNEIRQNFSRVVRLLCHLCKVKAFIIAIDDIDTRTAQCYHVLENLRLFISNANLIILMAGDKSMNIERIREKQFEEYSYHYHKADVDGQEVRMSAVVTHAGQYMAKLFPISHQRELRNLLTLSRKNKPVRLYLKTSKHREVHEKLLRDYVIEAFSYTISQNESDIIPYVDQFMCLPLRSIMQILDYWTRHNVWSDLDELRVNKELAQDIRYSENIAEAQKVFEDIKNKMRDIVTFNVLNFINEVDKTLMEHTRDVWRYLSSKTSMHVVNLIRSLDKDKNQIIGFIDSARKLYYIREKIYSGMGNAWTMEWKRLMKSIQKKCDGKPEVIVDKLHALVQKVQFKDKAEVDGLINEILNKREDVKGFILNRKQMWIDACLELNINFEDGMWRIGNGYNWMLAQIHEMGQLAGKTPWNDVEEVVKSHIIGEYGMIELIKVDVQIYRNLLDVCNQIGKFRWIGADKKNQDVKSVLLKRNNHVTHVAYRVRTALNRTLIDHLHEEYYNFNSLNANDTSTFYAILLKHCQDMGDLDHGYFLAGDMGKTTEDKWVTMLLAINFRSRVKKLKGFLSYLLYGPATIALYAKAREQYLEYEPNITNEGLKGLQQRFSEYLRVGSWSSPARWARHANMIWGADTNTYRIHSGVYELEDSSVEYLNKHIFKEDGTLNFDVNDIEKSYSIITLIVSMSKSDDKYSTYYLSIYSYLAFILQCVYTCDDVHDRYENSDNMTAEMMGRMREELVKMMVNYVPIKTCEKPEWQRKMAQSLNKEMILSRKYINPRQLDSLYVVHKLATEIIEWYFQTEKIQPSYEDISPRKMGRIWSNFYSYICSISRSPKKENSDYRDVFEKIIIYFIEDFCASISHEQKSESRVYREALASFPLTKVLMRIVPSQKDSEEWVQRELNLGD